MYSDRVGLSMHHPAERSFCPEPPDPAHLHVTLPKLLLACQEPRFLTLLSLYSLTCRSAPGLCTLAGHFAPCLTLI